MELLLLPSGKDLHSNCFIFLHPNRYSVNQKFICFCLPACLHSLFAVCFLPARACLKNALRKMCVTICGRFCSDEGVVVDYDNRIRTKYTAKWGVQIAGMIFQTHSRAYLKNHSRNLHILLCEKHFSNALKKELYFRNFKCVSISELHLNHEI